VKGKEIGQNTLVRLDVERSNVEENKGERKIQGGGYREGRPRNGKSESVAGDHDSCYQMSTVFVKEKFEMNWK
jgi:hypothetical protein